MSYTYRLHKANVFTFLPFNISTTRSVHFANKFQILADRKAFFRCVLCFQKANTRRDHRVS